MDTEQPNDQPAAPIDPEDSDVSLGKVVASYSIELTLRSSDDLDEVPTIDQLVSLITGAVEVDFFGVRASARATRTDR